MRKPFYLHFILLILAAAVVVPPATKAQQTKASNWPRGITYEIFVQSFCDSDGDGKGDIKGMTTKLDYLQDLGVSGQREL